MASKLILRPKPEILLYTYQLIAKTDLQKFAYACLWKKRKHVFLENFAFFAFKDSLVGKPKLFTKSKNLTIPVPRPLNH